MNILFDEKSHRYYENIGESGRTIVSVTQILSSGWEPDLWFGDKGRKIHKSFGLYLSGRLNENNLDGYIIPFLRGLKSFIADYKLEILFIEKITYNANPEYAGTIDIICLLGNKYYILDWKTGRYQTNHKYQLVLYGNAEDKKRFKYTNLGLVYFKEDGTYEFKEVNYDDKMKALDKALKKVDAYYEKQSVIFEPKAEVDTGFFIGE